MIDHLSSYTRDYDAAVRFYDAALGTLGCSRVMDMVTTWDPEFPTRRACAYGPGKQPVFWVVETRDECTPRHTAFSAADNAAVEAFYAAALEAGGADNGPPGPREHYHPGYFGAFVHDPDGNNIEAVCHNH